MKVLLNTDVGPEDLEFTDEMFVWLSERGVPEGEFSEKDLYILDFPNGKRLCSCDGLERSHRLVIEGVEALGLENAVYNAKIVEVPDDADWDVVLDDDAFQEIIVEKHRVWR